jgi:hypothetical protein
MAERPEFVSGEVAPKTATYEEINIFGQPTGIRAGVSRGCPFPRSPIGYFWRSVEEHSAEC